MTNTQENITYRRAKKSELATPGSAVRHVSVVRDVTDCAAWRGRGICAYAISTGLLLVHSSYEEDDNLKTNIVILLILKKQYYCRANQE